MAVSASMKSHQKEEVTVRRTRTDERGNRIRNRRRKEKEGREREGR